MIVELTTDNLDEIMAVEIASFDAEMRATRDTYRRRFQLGHCILAYRSQQLLGLISFSYGRFDPANVATIPDTFAVWSEQRNDPNFDTVFLYNLGVLPISRGKHVARSLVTAALNKARMDGCVRALAEAPIPSYAGKGHINADPAIRDAIDAYEQLGRWPDKEVLFRDPHLSFYRRLYNCEIVAIKPHFLPADKASGGNRVMLYAPL